MSRVVAIIQARTGSTRLPRKSLALINGRELVLHVVDRVASMKGLDALVIAIPEHDDELADVLSEKAHMPDGLIVRGPELNVLERFWIAAEQTAATTIVRVCGDSPLWCADVGEEVLAVYQRTLGCDYAWNPADLRHKFPGNIWPNGTDTEVFSRHLLDRARREAMLPTDQEDVTSWMRRRYGVTRVTIGAPEDYSKLKVSVDTQGELDRVRLISAHIPSGDYSLNGILEADRACLMT